MVDLIVVKANVITLDPACPKAGTIAIENNRIRAVGTDNDLLQFRNRTTRVIDCSGKTVLPGFIDAHCHIHALAESFVTLNLEPRNHIRSISDIQARIGDSSRQLAPGTWIRGRGYNEFSLAEKRHPNRRDLDEAAPGHPVKIAHRTGQAHVLNSLALRQAGISKETPDPPDGLIDRDLETGEPTGLLYRMGRFLSEKIPPLNQDQLDPGVKAANRQLLSQGITSVQDASSRNGVRQLKTFRRWKSEGLLNPRVVMMVGIREFDERRAVDLSTPLNRNELRTDGVKIMIDQTTGSFSPAQEELNEMVLKIHESGLQACLHAVEEKAVEAACTAIEKALKKLPKPDHRHRIEHCSVCSPPLARRLGSLGIVVVTQPSFIYYSGGRYLETVPKGELKHLYPIATLLKNGVNVAGSSDCPVAPAHPLRGIYAAASRKAEGGETLVPDERISPLEALRMYGDRAAEAAFEETLKGSICPGKLADLVVLNGDPTGVSIDEIKDLGVEMTILDGKVVWSKGS